MIDEGDFNLKITTVSDKILVSQRAVLSLSLVVGTCFFKVNDAKACSACVAAMLDNILPPLGIWCLFSVVWYLSASAIVTFQKAVIFGIPKLLPALLTAILCVIASLFVGPIFILLLLVPCLVSTIIIFKNFKKFTHRFAKHFKAVSSLGTACFIILIIYSGYIQISRSEVDFILKWPNTYIGKTKFDELYYKGPEGLKEIKAGFEKGDIRAVTNLCDSLSMHYNFENELQLRNLCRPYMGNSLE